MGGFFLEGGGRYTGCWVTEAVEEADCPAFLAWLVGLATDGAVGHRWSGEVGEDVSVAVRGRGGGGRGVRVRGRVRDQGGGLGVARFEVGHFWW